MKTKILALFLACIMTVLCLAACSGKKESSDNNGSTTASVGSNEFAAIDDYIAELASEHNFDGSTFTVIGKGSDHCEFEEETGSLENDALYRRMREIEESFGITYDFIVCTGENYASPSVEVASKVEADAMAGTGEYDAAECNVMMGGQTMLSAGVLQPVEELPGLDLAQSWWLNNIENQFGIGGHLYFLTGKIVTDHYSDASCILFNKQIAEDFGIDGLYDIVTAGEWTIDKMVEVTSVIPADGSYYRMSMGGYDEPLAYYFGGGFSICETDEEGNLSLPLALGSEKTDWIDKLATIFSDEKAYYIDKRNEETNDVFPDFADGNTFIFTDCMASVAGFRDKDVEFGVLPIPKRDVSQKEYISYSHAMAVSSYTVSKVVKDVEKVGVILEAMAALSEKHLEPAYYDKALKGRGTYDSESRDMLDLIYAAKKVDYAVTYQWGDAWTIFSAAVAGTKDGYVGDYTSSSRLANLKIKQLIKQVTSDSK
ncbi:MAG: hypothetical protein IJ457_01630 [Clostridia bacterium]|nr:hypothetical protein [Clostridia bacterium]